MPNLPASRLSNEDEFVLRPVLIVRSQWSAQWCGLATRGSRKSILRLRHEREREKRRGQALKDKKRKGREVGRGRGGNEEIESALTNLELTLYRYLRPTFDPCNRVPLAPSCFGTLRAFSLFAMASSDFFAGEEEATERCRAAHKTHRG